MRTQAMAVPGGLTCGVLNRASTALAATMLLLISACGSGSAPVPAEATSGAQSPVTPPAAASPLEAATGMPSEVSERNQHFVTMQRRSNEQIVQCMAAAGHRYFVEPVSPSLVLGPRSGDGSRAWVEVNGMGIVTSLLELAQPDPVGRVDAAAANQAYSSTLDPGEATSYDQALIGDGTGPGESEQFAPDGCWGQAYAVLVRQLAVMTEFEAELAALNDRIDADPRVAKPMQSWSACMAERGESYADRQELSDNLFSRLLSVEYTQTETGLEFQDPRAVDDLLGQEIAVALHDFDCRQSVAGDLARIRVDYEQEFVDDNRSRISTMLGS